MIENKKYLDATREVVSTSAYLLGVSKEEFGKGFLPEIFERLEGDERSRLIRCLCRLRTDIERNFNAIRTRMKTGERISSMVELMDIEALEYVQKSCDVSLVRRNRNLGEILIELNRLMHDRLGACKGLFPAWVEWRYIRNLFIVPKGDTAQGAKRAAERYYRQKDFLPYGAFINWDEEYANPNLLNNGDLYFLRALYEHHGDQFEDGSKVTQAGKDAVDIQDLLRAAPQGTLIAIDAENADPVKTLGLLNMIEGSGLAYKIGKVLLVLDPNSPLAWQKVVRHTQLKVKSDTVERLKPEKSMVDLALTTNICNEILQNGVRSVMLLASDSDYAAMLQRFSTIAFIAALEWNKCGQAFHQQLLKDGVPYFYIDAYAARGAALI